MPFQNARGLAVATALSGALAGTTLAGCGPAEPRRNLLLITVDTLRPDRLSFNGHGRPTSPAIDRLALEGRVFPNSFSQAGWTLPSVATLLTGRYPRDHGATDFHRALDTRFPTLATLLRERGYDTRAYVSHVLLLPRYALSRGFDHFDFSVLDVGNPHAVATAAELTDLALAGLREAREPFFLWVHYFDPHFEYLRHPAYRWFGRGAVDRYDGEIAHTDAHLGRLLSAVERDDTVVVFTSDHGEEFGEHDGRDHGTLHEEVMRVPLIIRAPGVTPGSDPRRAQQIDLLPTILGLLDVELGFDVPGRDLLGTHDAEPMLFFERDRPPPWHQRAVVRGKDKLIVIEQVDVSRLPAVSRGMHAPVTNVRPGIYRYDLAEDPGERHNLYSASDPKSLELLALLTRHFGSRSEQEPERHIAVDEGLREQLRSLGYLD